MIETPSGYTPVLAHILCHDSSGVVVGRKVVGPYKREEWACWCTSVNSRGERGFEWGHYGSKEQALESFNERVPRYMPQEVADD